MPFQRLSLFGPLNSDSMESFVTAVQTLTSNELSQFRTLTRVYKDDSTPQGRRPSDFIRIRSDASLDSPILSSPVLELVDAPEMNKRPVTSRIIHTVPCTSGDPRSLVKSMGYQPAFAYFEQGYHIQIGTLQVRVHRIFNAQNAQKAAVDPDAMEQDGDVTTRAVAEEDGELEGIAIGDGETWIVQADVDSRMNQPDDIQRGIDALLTFKNQVQGFVVLDVILDELR